MGKIYVASLAAYNAGHLHGVWFEPEPDEDENWAKIKAMLDDSPVHGEDWAIHAYDEFPNLGENPSLFDIAEVAGLLEEYSHDEGIVFAAFAAYGPQVKNVQEALADHYAGKFESMEAWAEEYVESTGQLSSVPESLRYYFDYAAYARDQDVTGVAYEGSLYVFT